MNLRSKIFVLAAVAALGTALPPALAGESSSSDSWPEFRGSNRDNLFPEKGLLKTWPPGGPRLIWKYPECGGGYATVAIADELIFTAGDFGQDELVIALDLKGNLVWKSKNGKSWRGASPGARSTPTYSEGVIYHMNPAGRVAALQAKSGKELWAVDLKERFDAQYGAWALSESVAVDGKAVLCAPGGSRGRIVALDKMTGDTIWANTEISDSAAYCSPLVVTHNGMRQFITLLEESVVSVDVGTGKLLWSHRHKTPYGVNATTPLFQDGLVYITSGYGAGGQLLKINRDNKSVRQVWAQTDLDNCHAGVYLINGYLYGSGCRQSRKGFVCVDFSSGKTMWTELSLGKVSLAYADGLLYCLGYKGTVWLVDPSPKECRVVSQFVLPSKTSHTAIAYPVIFKGRLYIRHWNDLFVYDVKEDA